MAFEDWLYKKADQKAHNEILAFLMMVLGMNLLIGGFIITLITSGEPIFVPFMTQRPWNSSAILGLLMTVAGFSILLAGFILVIHYDREMAWYMREIEKSTMYKKEKTPRTAEKALEEWLGKEKESK